MTKKKILYLLLIVVAIVWGRILYSFIDFTADNNSTAASIPVENASGHSGLMEDTFELLLNYKDPFLKKAAGRPAPVISNPNISLLSPGPAKEKVELIWPQLTFKGRIQNKESTQELAVLEINGKSYLLGPMDEVNGLRMKKVIGDSLYCNFMGNDTLLVRDPLAK